jgi:nitric oxide reductase subunit C
MVTDRSRLLTLSLLAIGFLLYSFTLYSTTPAKTPAVTELSRKGKLVWQQYNCTGCHQVYGLGGYLGPDLTNTYSRKGPAYIKAFLAGGTVTMPNFQLNTEEMEALVAYLQNIDASGTADPRSFTIHTNGTIEQ